ncbi:MAG TPA: SUMF1/EgtB/PvdO family nonheme iron enzyme [Blastocatellia bacterium]|nr:SUMF1/EgtB/PvdO family nonheme iron enzyme [Blastocatellia bacterium]
MLGGRYQLDQCIGAGGMGEIYRARRLHIGDTVAVKVLRADVVENEQSRQRFYREARAAAMLHHPNAVVIHDFGEDVDRTVYIVMELLVGRSLRQLLVDEGSIGTLRAYGIIRQACAALDAGHRNGIIHRDIKPDNIFILDSNDGTDHIKILDFGIAKLLDSAAETASMEQRLTNMGTVIGTPHYMSPEQCRGEEADARSDIYSLGIVLYELLTGVAPFVGKTPTGIAIKHVTEQPRPPRELNRGITPSVERVVLRALEKHPDARHQTALDLARDFEAMLNENPDTLRFPAVDEFDPTRRLGPTSTDPREAAETSEQQAATIDLKAHETAPAVPRGLPAAPRPAAPRPAPPKPELPARRKSRAPFYVMAFIVLVGMAAAAFWQIKLRAERAAESALAGAVMASPTPESSPSPSPSAEPVGPSGMVYVPGGTLQIGRDAGGDENERPAHGVAVSPFFIDRTEVTNEQYRKFLEATGYPQPPSWSANRYPEGQDKYPVVDVTWEDAKVYAAWMGKRLPTEEEWEFAARGPEGRIYPWGNEWVPNIANVATSESEKRQLAPVGRFSNGASPYGLLDLSGNAWEWTASDYQAYPGGKVLLPAGYGNLKVIRGGSYESTPEYATATLRRGRPATRKDWPENTPADYSQTGFRCAQDVK